MSGDETETRTGETAVPEARPADAPSRQPPADPENHAAAPPQPAADPDAEAPNAEMPGAEAPGAKPPVLGHSVVIQTPPATELLPVVPQNPDIIPANTGSLGPDRKAVRALERQLLGGERTLKRREVAAGAGVSLLSARKLWRAMGFPNLGDDDVAFTFGDQDALTRIIELVRKNLLTEEAAISVTRAIGQMTDRMAVWQVEAIVEDMVIQQGISDLQARRRLVDLLPQLIEPLEETLIYEYRRQLNAAVQRLVLRAEAGLLASAEGREGGEDDTPLPLARAVGFADLVSYTSLSRRMNEKTLAQLVQRFENKCAEIISVGGGRLVKTVGDEVLFNAETPEAGAEISLALASAFTDDELVPEARVSMVYGRILSRLGDIYGPTVNLAARLTSLAEPGTVLTESATAARLSRDERFVLMPQKVRSVRGFGDIHPVILARGEGPGLVLD